VGVHNRVINKLCVTNSTYSLNLEEEHVQGKRVERESASSYATSCSLQCREPPFAGSSVAGTVASVALCLLDVLT
jgi:hypothetical protein